MDVRQPIYLTTWSTLKYTCFIKYLHEFAISSFKST